MNSIEGELPSRFVTWVLLEAGLDPCQAGRLFDLQHPARPSDRPAAGEFAFARSEGTEESRLVTLSPTPSPKILRVSVADPSPRLSERLSALFGQYAATSGGESYRDFETIAKAQKADAARVDLALSATGCATISADRTGRRVDEKTGRVLVDVFAQGGHHARAGVLFLLQAPRTPRAIKRVLGAWLLDEFPKFENRRLRGHIGAALLDLVCPEHGPRLTELVLDPRLGQSRGALCLPLAMAKEPLAPSTLASLLDGDLCPSALHGLARLGPKAVAHAGAVEPLLLHGAPGVRRLAKKVLARMGVGGERPPEGAHLVRGRNTGPPPGLSEWSTNLDACDLEEALGVIGSAVDDGFGQVEISEVVATADNLKVDQARQFHFPIQFDEAAYDLWLGIFMDDEEAPDLYLESAPEILKRIDTAWRTSRFGKDVPA